VIELVRLALLAQLTAPAPGRVRVESDTACPAASDVEARLAPLLPPLGPGETPERAAIRAEGDARVRVSLFGADDAPVGDRTLALGAACADRANVVAVVVAAWEAQRAREDVAAPSLPRRPAPPPVVAAPVVAAAAPPPAPPPAWTLELALGPAVTLVDGGASPAAALSVGAWGRRLGARAGLFGFWPRTDGVGAGSARWARAGASLELGARARTRAGRFDAHAGVVGAALVAAGSGFELDRTASGLSPGAAVGVDWSYLFARTFVGAGASAVGWTAQRLVSDGDVRSLPRWQLSLDARVGVSF
jgi:hypothetical protein